VRDQLDGLLDEAGRQELSLRETLVLLCEREIARKDERRIEMTLKLARFPFVRDLPGFDFAAQPSIDPKQVHELAGARWIANGKNVLLLGPARRGQDPSRRGARARSDPGRVFRSVRRRHDGRGPTRQGHGEGKARGGGARRRAGYEEDRHNDAIIATDDLNSGMKVSQSLEKPK
jgi:hypothetical protein